MVRSTEKEAPDIGIMQMANIKLVGTAALRRPRHRAQRRVDGTEITKRLFYHVRCAAIGADSAARCPLVGL